MNSSNKETASMSDATFEWVAAAIDRVNVSAKLAVAEARLALVSVIMLFGLAVLFALCLFSLWALSMVALGSALMNLGLSLLSACSGLIVLHGAALTGIVMAMRSLSKEIEFRSTRQQLQRVIRNKGCSA